MEKGAKYDIPPQRLTNTSKKNDSNVNDDNDNSKRKREKDDNDNNDSNENSEEAESVDFAGEASEEISDSNYDSESLKYDSVKEAVNKASKKNNNDDNNEENYEPNDDNVAGNNGDDANAKNDESNNENVAGSNDDNDNAQDDEVKNKDRMNDGNNNKNGDAVNEANQEKSDNTNLPYRHSVLAELMKNGRKCPLFLRIARVANEKDMARRQFVIKYETIDLMQYFYALGVMDVIWSSQLEVTPHQVVPFLDFEQTISWSKNRGHLWVPPTHSDPRSDAGVLRKKTQNNEETSPKIKKSQIQSNSSFLG